MPRLTVADSALRVLEEETAQHEVQGRCFPEVRIHRGAAAMLRRKQELMELARVCGQPGAADHLDYSLGTRLAHSKIPVLLLMSDAGVPGVCGAVLLFEYRVAGVGTRLYTSFDGAGRRTVIAPAHRRAEMTAAACRSLQADGAQMVLVNFHTAAPEAAKRETMRSLMDSTGIDRPRPAARWAMVEREIPLYLPLERTFDQTLARIGQKTRANLRYYRRRAERELGCVFEAEARIGLEEFLVFNRACSFVVPDELARWRYEALGRLERSFLQGIRDGEERWLSLAAGRRSAEAVEIDWQMNREDMPTYSLSIVMRSYLIEHEVSVGSTRLYIEGGTPSPLQNSFVKERGGQMILERRTLYARMVRRFARRLFPPNTQMAQMLVDRDLAWERC